MDDVLDQSLSVAVPARTSNAPATGAERIVVGRPGWTERATERGEEREQEDEEESQCSFWNSYGFWYDRKPQ